MPALAVPSLTGCTLLGFPYLYGDPSTWDPQWEDHPEPSIAATFTSGSATLTFDDACVVELDRVAPSSHSG